MNTNEHEWLRSERWDRHSCLSHLGLILNFKHATLDALRDRFILVRVYGETGLVFGFEMAGTEATNHGGVR